MNAGPLVRRLVLVVEDDPSVAEILVAAFHTEGHVVETGVNGRVALEMIEDRCCELILSNLWMPEGLGVFTVPK